ncbi:hypothetical protein GQE99_01440 [Maritimibacter sp. DP07]|uniref:TRAP-type C4-dicarboxylate transport system, substrate-binding protein n=1 Tax=Maritimibacter harenae TaxID=2606218 RepID=A0A845M1U4_9RHOB|nr:TRAP transporter substrate-binding protein DctP [Maritimibacter harenae]MZR11687.1 hypothetical protein [Maritimibacter harenae]
MLKQSLTVLTLTAALGTAASASAQEITFNSWLPPQEPINSVGMVPFWERVSEATNGEVTGKMFFAGQLMGQGETFDGVSDQAVGGGQVIAAFAPNKVPHLATIEQFRAISPDPRATAAAMTETALLDCPECLEEAAENDLVPLGGHSNPTYYLMCSTEVESVEDLNGLRLRAPSRFDQQVATSFGMSPVSIPFPELATGFQRGVVDCAMLSRLWLDVFKFGEVVKTIVDGTFGASAYPMMVSFNKEVWDGLSDDARAAIKGNMPQVIAAATITMMQADAPAVENAKANGMKIVDLGGEFQTAFDAYVGSEEESIRNAFEPLGVENFDALLASYQENYSKWEGLLADVGEDIDAFAGLLKSEIYDNLSY